MVRPLIITALSWCIYCSGLLKTKDANWKRAFPATLQRYLVSLVQPIFGLLRFGKPFIMGLIAGAAGGWLASILNLASGTWGFGVLFFTLAGQRCLNVIITLALGFNLLGSSQKRKKLSSKRSWCWRYCICRISSVALQAETIAAPLKGEGCGTESVC